MATSHRVSAQRPLCSNIRTRVAKPAREFDGLFDEYDGSEADEFMLNNPQLHHRFEQGGIELTLCDNGS